MYIYILTFVSTKYIQDPFIRYLARAVNDYVGPINKSFYRFSVSRGSVISDNSPRAVCQCLVTHRSEFYSNTEV